MIPCQKDFLRISWCTSYELDNLLLYDAENQCFDTPSKEFWNTILPFAQNAQLQFKPHNKVNVECKVALPNPTTIYQLFEIIHKHLHSKI